MKLASMFISITIQQFSELTELRIGFLKKLEVQYIKDEETV